MENGERRVGKGGISSKNAPSCHQIDHLIHTIVKSIKWTRGHKLNSQHAMALNFYACHGIMTQCFWVGGCVAIVGVFFIFPSLGHAMQMESGSFPPQDSRPEFAVVVGEKRNLHLYNLQPWHQLWSETLSLWRHRNLLDCVLLILSRWLNIFVISCNCLSRDSRGNVLCEN